MRSAVGIRRLFLPMGAVILVIGALDLVSAGNLEARALGLVFFVIGVLMCAAGLNADASPRHVQVAAVTGMVVGLLFVSAALPDFWRPWPTAACIGGVAVVCLCAIVAVRSLRPEKSGEGDREERANAAPVTAQPVSPPNREGSSGGDVIVTTAATLGAAILALVGTWYGASYAPALTTPALNVTAEFEDAGVGTELRAVPLVVTAKNAGTRTLRLLQAYYEIHGLQMEMARTPEQPSESAMAAPFKEGDYGGPVQRFSRDTTTKTSRLVQFGRVFEDGVSLVPNQEITSRVLVHIPKQWKKDVQGLRVMVDIAAVRQDQVPLPRYPSSGPDLDEAPRPGCKESTPEGGKQPVPCTEVESEWPVERSSVFQRIVRHPRCVYIGVQVYAHPRLNLHGGIPEFPSNYAFVADGCGASASGIEEKRPQQEFLVTTVTEQSLWEPKGVGSEAGTARKT